MVPAFSSATAFVITPSDTVSQRPMRGIYVGGTGNITVRFPSDPATGVLISAIPVGTILPIAPSLVMSTGTTATLLVGLA